MTLKDEFIPHLREGNREGAWTRFCALSCFFSDNLVRFHFIMYICRVMGRKKSDNPKVPLTLSVLRSTKDYIRENDINAGEILDNMFNQNK